MKKTIVKKNISQFSVFTFLSYLEAGRDVLKKLYLHGENFINISLLILILPGWFLV